MPGHQVVGRVERVGAAVGGWAVGDRAGVAWLAGDLRHAARFCTGGPREPLRGRAFTGWDRDGGYAERIAVRADFALRLPDGFDDLAAAPLLCGGVIGYRSLKVSGIQPGGRLGLFGFGASALLTLQVARHWGCEVYVWTRSTAEQRAGARARRRERGRLRRADADRSTPRSRSRRPATSSSPRCARSTAAARSPSTRSTSTASPSSRTTCCGGSAACAASPTSRGPTRGEFLELAAAIPIRTAIETFPLEDGNDALRGLATGGLEGTAVLTMGDG